MAGNTAVGRISIGSAAVPERQTAQMDILAAGATARNREGGCFFQCTVDNGRVLGAARWRSPIRVSVLRCCTGQERETSKRASQDEGGDVVNLFFPQFPVFFTACLISSLKPRARTRAVHCRVPQRGVHYGTVLLSSSCVSLLAYACCRRPFFPAPSSVVQLRSQVLPEGPLKNMAWHAASRGG